jgi:hypothetical protein
MGDPSQIVTPERWDTLSAWLGTWLERLRAAIRGRDHRVTFLGVDPKWDALRGSAPFRGLLSEVNLLEVSDRVRRPQP